MSETELQRPSDFDFSVSSQVKLTTKQRLFLDHYFGDAKGNATRAAELAGYRGDRKSLQAMGYQTLNNPKIKQLIQEWASKQITPQRVIEILASQASASMEDFISFGSPKKRGGDPFFDLQRAKENGKLHLIREMEINDDGKCRRVRLKLHDPQLALNMLGKHFGLFTKDAAMRAQMEHLLRILPQDVRERVRAAVEGLDGGDGSLPALESGEDDGDFADEE